MREKKTHLYVDSQERTLTNHKELGLPSFESVGRTRRKLQEKHPELLGNVRTQKIRAAGEKAYRKYARES